MNLVRYNPHRRMSTRARKDNGFFNDLFDDFFTPFVIQKERQHEVENLSLKVDIYEKDSAVYIDAELPGIDKEDISVDVKGKIITLGGERKFDNEIKVENRYRRERSYGKFERTFRLPFEVKSENVKANFRNGILKLEIPKPEEQAARKIAINQPE